MRDRPLVRLFLHRFIENDFISPTAGRLQVLSIGGGMIAGASLCLSVLVAAPYQFNIDMPPGLASLHSLDDRFVFVAASMLILALIAVIVWDGLTLDPRDGALLGVLPIPRRRIVRAKMAAVCLLALAADVGWNAPSTLLRFTAVPAMLPIGVPGLLRLTLAHTLVTMAAGAFGFFGVVAIREVLAATLGQRRFAAVSPIAQALLLSALIVGLLLIPGAATNVGRSWLASGTSSSRTLPPFWFVSAHEVLAGDVFDTLPRVSPRLFERQERSATATYRELNPVFRRLARRAVASIGLTAALLVIAHTWNNRRLPEPASRVTGAAGGALAWVTWLLARVPGQSRARQAGFWFTLQTLPRSGRHRTILAASFAVGATLDVLALRGVPLTSGAEPASIPTAVLAAEALLLGPLLVGMRRAAEVPADPRASVTFDVTWQGGTRHYLSGVTRAVWVSAALPTAAAFLVWHAFVLGPAAAALHAVVISLWAFLSVKLLFRNAPSRAFAEARDDEAVVGAAARRLATVVLVALLLASVERHAFARPAVMMLLVAVLAIASASIAAAGLKTPGES